MMRLQSVSVMAGDNREIDSAVATLLEEVARRVRSGRMTAPKKLEFSTVTQRWDTVIHVNIDATEIYPGAE